MRVLIVALLAAISYAQTEVKARRDLESPLIVLDPPDLVFCIDDDTTLQSFMGAGTSCTQFQILGLCEQIVDGINAVKNYCQLSCDNCVPPTDNDEAVAQVYGSGMTCEMVQLFRLCDSPNEDGTIADLCPISCMQMDCPPCMLMCMDGQERVSTVGDDGCETCECRDMDCPPCMLMCMDGQERVVTIGDDGCETCECRNMDMGTQDGCEGKSCGDDCLMGDIMGKCNMLGACDFMPTQCNVDCPPCMLMCMEGQERVSTIGDDGCETCECRDKVVECTVEVARNNFRCPVAGCMVDPVTESACEGTIVTVDEVNENSSECCLKLCNFRCDSDEILFDDNDRIAQMYGPGFTCENAAEYQMCSATNIQEICPITCSEPSEPEITTEILVDDNDRMAQMYGPGFTCENAAEYQMCSVESIQEICPVTCYNSIDMGTQDGCEGKWCGDDCLMGDIMGKCNRLGACDFMPTPCNTDCAPCMQMCMEGQERVVTIGDDGCETCECRDNAESTDSGDYTCGSTMEECEAAYQAAMTPAVEVMIPTMTYDSCDTADGWWVSGTLNGLAGYDAETMSVCVSDGQYMVEVDGKVYATCVAYGTPNQDTCTDDSLVCPSLPSDPNTFGWGGNQRSALAAAMTRADFKHPECPTSTCMSMDTLADSGSYWKDQVLSNPYTSVTEAAVDNVCVTPDNEVMMITREGMCNTCLGWSSVATDICDTQKFICAGHSGQGEFTYGWPGQIARTLAVAVANEEGNYMHPQCPVNICSA